MLRIDRHEHLDDVILGEAIEDDRRDGEALVAEALDVGVQREQAMLAVDGAKDPLALRDLQEAERRVGLDRLELQRFVTRDDDGAGDRRQVPGLAALLVVGDELVDLPPDDRALVGLFARGDAALQQIPVDLRRRGVLLLAAADRLRLLSVVEDFESHELVDVVGRERCLVELHPELLHPNGGDADQ
jgi:hypothetical protein